MSDIFFSPLWYRVAGLKPRLRGHIKLHRHDYRGLIWYVLEDKSSGRHHRFSSSAYQVIGSMDGESSVDQIWESTSARLGDYAPTQDEVIRLLGQLHAADLLQCEVPPDTEELFQRHQMQESAKIKGLYRNPLSQKIPLWDPEDFLERFSPWVRWMFHWSTSLVWVLIISIAALLAGIHWEELTGNLIVHSFSPYNLLILCLVYPVIKLLHELGHAFATKIEGGEVHEMGIMFLVFMPIPYVNVSAACAFRSKHKRMRVGAAGIAVELFLAALALFIWLSVEPGVVREVAFNIILIGGVSSLFFNGNPLLRYDGYYVLSDAIGIPNLYQRSTKYLGYLCQRYLFGAQDLNSPATAPGEAGWFVTYSISSFLYRIGILWLIIVFVTEKFFVIGVLLAGWLVTLQLLLPLAKMVSFLATSLAIQRQRIRAVCVSSSLMTLLLLLITFVPFPSSTQAEGVVWLPEDAQLRTETDGFINQILAEPGSEVPADTPLIQVEDPFLHTQVKVLESKLKELQAQYHADWLNDQVQAAIIKEDINAVKADLENAREKENALIVRSPKAGTLLIPMPEDQPGRFVHHGDLIGYIIDESTPIARVVITQADIGKVREGIVGVELRLASHLNRTLPATVLREVPQATNKLPSAALATTSGGLLTIDPSQQDGLTTLEKIFQFDVEFSPPNKQLAIGTRVYVRFDHGSEALARQWYRCIRQIFLRQFDV